MKDKVVTLQGNLLLESKVTKGAKIEEDLTSSVLESSLTTEEKDSIEKLRETIQNRLEKQMEDIYGKESRREEKK